MNITLHPDTTMAQRQAAANKVLTGQKPAGQTAAPDGMKQMDLSNVKGGIRGIVNSWGQNAGNGISNYSGTTNNSFGAANSIPSAGSGAVGAVTPAYGPRRNTYDGQGNIGIRAALNAAGVENDRISWQDGTVYVDGKPFKPASVQDGVSYGGESDVHGYINSIYKNQGDDLIRISDYISGTGVSIQPTYDNGKVYLGGQEVPYAYIENGRAYVQRSVLDGIYKNLAKKAGIMATDEAYQHWRNQHQNRLDNKLSNIENSKFDYSLDKDPAYQAYKNQYTREGERAYRAAAAQMAAQNGGNMTSMAQSAANQQLNYYMQQLGDRVPELQQNAYNRFDADRNARIQAYDRYVNAADSDYNRRQYANELARQQYLEGYNELKNRDPEQRQARLYELNITANTLANQSAANQTAQQIGGYTPYTREAAGVPEDWDAYVGTQKQSDIEVDAQNRMVSHQLSEQNKYTLEQMAAEFGYNVDLKKLDYINETQLAELKSALDTKREIVAMREKADTEFGMYEKKDQYDWEKKKERSETERDIAGEEARVDAVIKEWLHRTTARTDGSGMLSDSEVLK